MSNRTKHICKVCGKEFYKWRYEKDRQCCSQKCGSISRRNSIRLPCLECGKEVIRNKSELNRHHHVFCSQKCYHSYNTGKQSFKYIGGHLNAHGYKDIYDDKKRTLEHRHIVEKKIGRKLLENEVIHHINGNKLDNRIENLQVMSRSEHAKYHSNLNIKWSNKHDKCIECGENSCPHRAKGLCKCCYKKQEYQKMLGKKKLTPDSPEKP